MTRIEIKPMSVNALYRGRRFKTQAYAKYQEDLYTLLPPVTIPDGKLSMHIIFGVSNPRSDVDNLAKGFIDGLQSRYGFNDRQIYELHMCKRVVKKGSEFVSFKVGGLK